MMQTLSAGTGLEIKLYYAACNYYIARWKYANKTGSYLAITRRDALSGAIAAACRAAGVQFSG